MMQKAIDQACDKLLNWKTDFCMDVIVNVVYEKNHDILSHVHRKYCNGKYSFDPITRFDPTQYNIDGGFAWPGFSKLVQDIEVRATFHGFSIICNGGEKYILYSLQTSQEIYKQ